MNSVSEDFDVVILGGGAAGSAAAIQLAQRGFEVALLERSRYGGRRVGETLPPEAYRFLQASG
jgi:flavin-dependent dehydrogenase